MPFCGAKLLRFLFSSVWEMGSPLLKVERSLHHATQGSVQAQGHDCRGPSSLLPPSSSGCSVRGAPHLMREDSAHLSLRPRVLSHVCIAYRLLLVREGRFSLLLPVPQAPPLLGGCHKPRCHASPQTRRARRGTHKTCPHVFTASFT